MRKQTLAEILRLNQIRQFLTPKTQLLPTLYGALNAQNDEVLHWILDRYPTILDLFLKAAMSDGSTEDDLNTVIELFRNACIGGYLEIAKQMLPDRNRMKTRPSPRRWQGDIFYKWTAMMQMTYDEASKAERISVADWLADICPEIDINHGNENYFKEGIRHNSIEVLDRLVRNDPDLLARMNVRKLVETAIWSQAPDSIQWLQSKFGHLDLVDICANRFRSTYLAKNYPPLDFLVDLTRHQRDSRCIRHLGIYYLIGAVIVHSRIHIVHGVSIYPCTDVTREQAIAALESCSIRKSARACVPG